MVILSLVLLVSLFSLPHTTAKSYFDLESDFGAIVDDSSHSTCEFNTRLLSELFADAQANNATLRLVAQNKTLHLYNGVYGENLRNCRFLIDGTLRFERKPDFQKVYRPDPCFMVVNSTNITFTTSTGGRGLVDGHGSAYWGIPYIGYAELNEHRPRLLKVNTTSDILIENMIFKDSPYHTVYLEGVENVIVRHVSIVARRTHGDGHNWIDLSAFNTDGIDVSGRNVHVHDVDIWVQDDCIAVKDNYFEPYVSADMVFERVNCSGFGLVVGSIGGTHVRNITFRDSYMHKSVKGIYLKFRRPEPFWAENHRVGSMSDISFHDISMEAPLQWPIWIGPAQQADAVNPCEPNPCSLCWPQAPFAQCHVVPKAAYTNITLRNVLINNPRMSPGVILGGEDPYIQNILFDTVRMTTGDPDPRARVPRTVSFPGLLQPIDDPYVPHSVDVLESKEPLLMMGFPKPGDTWFQILLMVAVALVITLHIYFCVKRRTKVVDSNILEEEETTEPLAEDDGVAETIEPPPTPDPPVVTPTKIYLWFWVVEIFLIFSIVTSQNWFTPRWERLNHYYRCEGVVGGKATRNTWPVPYCFEQINDDDNDKHVEESVVLTTL